MSADRTLSGSTHMVLHTRMSVPPQMSPQVYAARQGDRTFDLLCTARPGPHRLSSVDDYQIEMQEIQRTLARLKASDGDLGVIDELETELRILQALYATPLPLFEAGKDEPGLRTDFRATGLGGRDLGRGYSFLYRA